MTDHLGSYADWPDFMLRRDRSNAQERGAAQMSSIGNLVRMAPAGRPLDARVERTWERDGIAGEEVSWSVGFGPRTYAWLLRPAGASGPLPGVLALHGHDDFKLFGKEKIADGPDGPVPSLLPVRADYGHRALANSIAEGGFVVLVPDVFSWGSRRFEWGTVSAAIRSASQLSWMGDLLEPANPARDADAAIDPTSYNRGAALHEDIVERLCRVLGTSFAGAVAFEDGIALDYLRSRSDRCEGPVVAIGCSGGGARAALVGATSSSVDVVVIVGMMSTYGPMIDRHVATHTWLLFPPNLAPDLDWPDVAASRAPAPLLVQYALDDALFPRDGMLAAHDILVDRYRTAGRPDSYVGQFFDGGHRFDREMQDAAIEQIRRFLAT